MLDRRGKGNGAAGGEALAKRTDLRRGLRYTGARVIGVNVKLHGIEEHLLRGLRKGGTSIRISIIWTKRI